MMMIFAQFSAYYFAVGIRYFDPLNKTSTSFIRVQSDFTAILQLP